MYSSIRLTRDQNTPFTCRIQTRKKLQTEFRVRNRAPRDKAKRISSSIRQRECGFGRRAKCMARVGFNGVPCRVNNILVRKHERALSVSGTLCAYIVSVQIPRLIELSTQLTNNVAINTGVDIRVVDLLKRVTGPG